MGVSIIILVWPWVSIIILTVLQHSIFVNLLVIRKIELSVLLLGLAEIDSFITKSIDKSFY